MCETGIGVLEVLNYVNQKVFFVRRIRNDEINDQEIRLLNPTDASALAD